MTMYTVTFDGGSLGNPGKGYGSYQIERSGTDTVLRESVDFDIGPVTNNEAEYLTLIQALHRLLDSSPPSKRSARSVVLIGDSKLVLNQVSGQWQVSKELLGYLRDAVWELITEFADVRTTWVPRAEIVKLFGH